MTSSTARTPSPVDAVAASLLGIDESLTGKRWVLTAADDRGALMLAQRLDLPEAVARVLASRGVEADEVADFLAPTLKGLLPDPSILKDMDRAVERLCQAITSGEKIAVFADYDVDGATSSSLLYRFLSAVGAPPRIYVPDRIKEGYGPSIEALLSLKNEGADVVITVDCGAVSFEPLRAAADAGLDVIVCDHHAGEAQLPAATAVINPNRFDEDGKHGHLAAVGVAFLLVVGLNRALRAAGWYTERSEPDPRDWLDLVALGTVCDVVPLRGVNRALVAQGLKVMARRGNAGLRALADVAGMEEFPTAYHAGFLLGPRINAGGRVGEADLGARLLTCDDDIQARPLAERLDALNGERRALEAAVFEGALAAIEASPPGAAAVVAGAGWHPGVVGIVASRLVERLNRPACVIAIDGDTGTGSGRSVSGIDLGGSIIAARQAGLLVKGGGHPMAAGFTVEMNKLNEFRKFLESRIDDQVAAAAWAPTLKIDGAVGLGAATHELISTLARLAPFGAGNPEPRFAIARVRVGYADRVGDNHVRCRLTDESGTSLKGICFRVADTPMGQALLKSDGATFHIAGRLRLNSWQGRETPEVLIDDAAAMW